MISSTKNRTAPPPVPVCNLHHHNKTPWVGAVLPWSIDMMTISMATIVAATTSFILVADHVVGGATTTDDAAVAAVAPTHPPPGIGAAADGAGTAAFVPDPNAPITFCLGGCPSITEQCVGNQNHPQGISDDDCMPCNSGQTYWPCDTEGLCFCWDPASNDRIPPAPGSGLALHDDAMRPCDYFTEDVFGTLAPDAKEPYTYDGLCDAIDNYNDGHAEKIFMMGTERERKSEVRVNTFERVGGERCVSGKGAHFFFIYMHTRDYISLTEHFYIYIYIFLYIYHSLRPFWATRSTKAMNGRPRVNI